MHIHTYICMHTYTYTYIQCIHIYISIFSLIFAQILKKSSIENFVTLKHVVFGYKIFDKDYFDFNYFLTILGFSIYKAYYVLHTHLHLHTYIYAYTHIHMHAYIYIYIYTMHTYLHFNIFPYFC
jgi:hypothetical protein